MNKNILTRDRLHQLSQEQKSLGKNPKYVPIRSKILHRRQHSQDQLSQMQQTQNSGLTKEKIDQILSNNPSPMRSQSNFNKTQNGRLSQSNINLAQNKSVSQLREYNSARPESKQSQQSKAISNNLVQQQSQRYNTQPYSQDSNNNLQQFQPQSSQQDLESVNAYNSVNFSSERQSHMGISKQSFMERSFSQKYGKLLDQNKQYLKHLQGDCLCGKCLCGKCKCPKMVFNYANEKGKSTLYKSDFIPKSVEEQQLPTITMDFHNSYQSQAPMEYNTTNKQFYTPHDVKDMKRVKKNQKGRPEYPFLAGSSYKQNFINWGNYKNINLAPKIGTTIVPDLNFTAKTIYKDSFNKGNRLNKDADGEFIKSWAKRANFKNPDFPFQGVTTNNNFFRNQRIPQQIKISQKQDYLPQPSFKGQYLTNQQQSANHRKIIDCPSRKQLSVEYKKQVEDNVNYKQYKQHMEKELEIKENSSEEGKKQKS